MSSTFSTFSLHPTITYQDAADGLIQDPSAGTLTANALAPTILPAVCSSDRQVLGKIDGTGLNSCQRQIFPAVLPSIKADREARLQCILGGEIDILNALPRIYKTGLHAARNIWRVLKPPGTGSNKRRSADDTTLDASQTT
ncbi:hypothetical protein Q9L58_006885 [Maublancomyces gigas]|uniref:Uncharacterized protein n=1 Tax=Discina gigas TaxID=1032678 RepID=A0ABR3GE17_9PEZI